MTKEKRISPCTRKADGTELHVFSCRKGLGICGLQLKSWREKTCEDCCFRVGDECRRFPQFKEVVDGYTYVTSPFQVEPTFEITGYAPACSEHAEILQPTLTIKEAVR